MRATTRDREFVNFVTVHRSDLVKAARLLAAGDHDFAEDLVQQALTKLYVAWPRVRRADSQIAYARRTLTNTFIDEGTRAHRRRERLVEAPVATVASTGEDPDLRRTLWTALAGLPPRQRAVVVLRHWCDLDTATTAETLSCSTGTVKSQNAKALEHLRALLPVTLLEDLS